APTGNARGEANQAAPGRRAAAAMALSRLRLARLVGRVFNGRKPDGRASRREPLDRGPGRPPHVPLALPSAWICSPRSNEGDDGYAWAPNHAAYRAAREAALRAR